MEFNVWDIGGPASMATVNQCFFTDKALYVVVWNLALGEEAVASLQFWLLNIEVRSTSPSFCLWSPEKHRGPATAPGVPCSERKGIMSGRNAVHLEGLSQSTLESPS